MSFDSHRYFVFLEPFAESNFVKDFRKRHGWDVTWRSIEQMLMRFDPELLGNRVSSPIWMSEDRQRILYKVNFSIAVEGKSPKASGNRMIVLCDESKGSIRILLVYHKRHLRSANETDWWKKIVRREFGHLLDESF